MQRFHKILYVNEPAGEKQALLRAIRLAEANNAQLTIVTISEELPRSMDNLSKSFLKIQKEQIRTMLRDAPTKGLSIETRHLMGTPFLEIIKEVMDEGHDLVIKPAEGHKRFHSMLFGTTDLHLIRKCPCPVWIIKPHQGKKYSRIIAAVDPDPGQKANAELNKNIMDLATALAKKEGSKLHIVHCWHLANEGLLRKGQRALLQSSDLEKLLSNTRKTHKNWLAEMLGNYDLKDLNAKVHLLKGDAGEKIPELAEKKNVDLIIMGTVERTGIPGFFIGNTAERTLTSVDCSVLAVKPQGFLTPVQAERLSKN